MIENMVETTISITATTVILCLLLATTTSHVAIAAEIKVLSAAALKPAMS